MTKSELLIQLHSLLVEYECLQYMIVDEQPGKNYLARLNVDLRDCISHYRNNLKESLAEAVFSSEQSEEPKTVSAS